MDLSAILNGPDTGDGQYSHPQAVVLHARLDGDTHDRLQILANGSIYTGNGISAPTLFSGGGGGAVDSVNAQTGVVVLDAGDIGFTPNGSISAADVQAAIQEVRDEAAGATNLGYTASPTDGTVTSDTGADATLPVANGTNAGLLLPAGFTKLAGIEAGATADQSDAEILAALLNVDGPGSGINADLLDGNNSTAFAIVANNLSDLASAVTARANLGLGLLATKGVTDSGTVTWVTSGADIVAAAQVTRFGNLFVTGHSFASLVGNDAAQKSLTWPRRLAARLQMNPNELSLQAKSASFIHNNHLINPNLFLGPGIGGILRSIYPSSSYAKSSLRDTQPPNSTAWPHIGVHLWGINDLVYSGLNYGTPTPYAEMSSAIQDGYRTILSRARAARIYDVANAAWAFSGMTLTARNNATRKRCRTIGANSQTGTFTIPTTARVGDILAFAFHAGPDGYALLNGAMTSGATTFDCDDHSVLASFPTTYPFSVTIDSETMTVTGRSTGTNNYRFTVTRTAGVAHNDNAVVRRAASTKVTATGTAGWTDQVILDARGAQNNPQTVVIRKTLTEAMIGMTVIWTSSGYLSEPSFPVGIDAAWIEDPNPPFEFLVEQWRQIKLNTDTSDTLNTEVASYNADVATVAAEFTNVTVVPAEAYFSSRFAGVLRAGSSLSNADAPGTARTISVTPDTFASFEIAAGQVIGVHTEDLLITSVVNNTTYYTIGVKRGHNSTTPVTAAAGALMFMTQAVGNDRIHPSDYGQLLIANMVYDTMKNAALTGAAAGGTGDYGVDHATYPPENVFYSEPWLWPSGARANCTLNTLPGTQWVEWMVPVDIFDQFHLTALGVWFYTAPTGTKTFNFVVRKFGPLGGDEMLQYVAASKSGTGEMSAVFDLPLRPGRYMFGLQCLETTGAALGAVRGYWPAVDIPLSMATATMADPGQSGGYYLQHLSAVPSASGCTGQMGGTAQTGMPMIAMKGVAPPRD